mgnify:CR=1 FL=1
MGECSTARSDSRHEANLRVGVWTVANCKKKRLKVFEALHTPLEVLPASV